MKKHNLMFVLPMVLLTCLAAATRGDEPEECECQALFDGKTLDGWEGKTEFWSVRDGAITGQTTADNPTKGNTFLIWRGGELVML